MGTASAIAAVQKGPDAERILLVGAGNFGREVYNWMARHGLEHVSFLDDTPNLRLPEWYPPILGTVKHYSHTRGDKLLVCVAEPDARMAIVAALGTQTYFYSWYSDATMAPTVSVGVGTILCPGSVVSADAKVGAHVQINIGAAIGHDVRVGDFCTISSQVDLMGHVVLGQRVFVGSGARVLPGVKVGDGARIGAGAVVVKDVEDGQTIYGPSGRTL